MSDGLYLGGVKVHHDDIKATRCDACGQMVRDPTGAPTVPIRVADVKELICLLVEYVHCPSAWADTIGRLERAVGKTHAALQAEARKRTLTMED